MTQSALILDDLSKLSQQEQLDHYNEVCNSLGLNPHTRPFAYIKLNNKLTLYARKDATDQLRKIHGVSIYKVDKLSDPDGTYTVTAYARDKDGREDVEDGIVFIGKLTGEYLANAKMKALTKSKRRVTLSICGLGILDESEADSIPDAQPVEMPVAPSKPPEPKLTHDTPNNNEKTRKQAQEAMIRTGVDFPELNPSLVQLLSELNAEQVNDIADDKLPEFISGARALYKATYGELIEKIIQKEGIVYDHPNAINNARNKHLGEDKKVAQAWNPKDIPKLKEYLKHMEDKANKVAEVETEAEPDIYF